jgi:hypothetical protein
MKYWRVLPAAIIYLAVIYSPYTVCIAQDRVKIHPSQEPIVLDGLLIESCWGQSPVISDFRQRDPKEGEPATERTEIRVVYHQKALYIGIVCLDSNPELIVAKEMRRDGAVEADDSITLILDTYLDHRNAFYFAFNSNGARKDALIVDESQSANVDWNAVWDVKTVVTDKGWQAEVMIPFDTLRFKPSQQQWGINFRRMIPRKNEEALWQAYRRNAGIFRISEAGLLEGIPSIEQAHRYEIRPYFSFGLTETPSAGNQQTADLVHDHETKVGFDSKIKLAKNLVADITVNTDFAQTEVDQAVVNLTRFPVRFPEKRDFFLENAGFFDFLSPGNNRLFFSRRIGLSSKGEPIPIDIGGRVTGKIGAFDLGFLNVQTRSQDATPAGNYTAIRPKFGIFKKSYVGAIFTNVYNNVDGNRNQAYGFDSVFSFSNFFGQNISISSSIAQTATRGMPGDRSSGYFGVSFPNDWVEAWFNYGFTQKNFNPELGFLGRGSVEQYSARWRFQPRPPAPWNKWIRKLYFKPLDINIYNTLPGRELESLSQEFRPIGFDFQSGETFEFNIIRHFDRLDEDFNIFEDVVIPRGRYWWNTYQLQFSTSSKRRWQIDGATSWGGYYQGDFNQIEIQGGLKINSHLSVSGGYATNRADYISARFTTHEMSSRLVYAFSNRANLQVFSQWNNETKAANIYVRLHIIPKIGSDIYGIFNQLLNTRADRRTNAGRAVRGKVVYPFYR